MKAKVYYQDLSLNACMMSDDRAILIPDKAVLVKEFEDCDALVESRFGPFVDISLINNEDRAGAIRDELNDWNTSPKYSNRYMSVGDYIIFDNGEIWIALPIGWDIRLNNSLVKK
jgi:hypothetical protein